MNDCEKIESLLWESLERNLSDEVINFIEGHLSGCERCRETRATIEAISESKLVDKGVASGIDADEFESAVFQKIKMREGELRFEKEDRGYMVRLYFSVGLAAAIVAFIVLSLGDLDRYILPIHKESKRTEIPKRNIDTLHITLTPSDSYEAGEPPPPAAGKKSPDIEDEVLILMPPPSVGADTDVMVSVEEPKPEMEPPETEEKGDIPAEGYLKSRLEADSVVSDKLQRAIPNSFAKSEAALESREEISFRSGGEQQTGDFSILSEPVSNPAPDSVVINSIYLSDESIPMASQQMRAYLPEVIVDSGRIQALETPRSVLVTVDKMPVPVKIIPPEYPVWAKKNEISGDVWVKARVDKDGNVVSAEVLSSSMPGYGFEEASLEAARQCKYLPAEANGFKIPISVIYPVHFVFKDKDVN